MVSNLVVPYFDEPVVCSRDEVRFLPSVVVIYAVYTLLVTLQGKVRVR